VLTGDGASPMSYRGDCAPLNQVASPQAIPQGRALPPPGDRSRDRNDQHHAALKHDPANGTYPRCAIWLGVCLHLLIAGSFSRAELPSHDSQRAQPLGARTDFALKIPDRGRLWAVSADETTLNNEIQRWPTTNNVRWSAPLSAVMIRRSAPCPSPVP